MKKAIRIITALLALAMVFSVAACGGTDNTPSSAPSSNAPSSAPSNTPSSVPGTAIDPGGSVSQGGTTEQTSIVVDAVSYATANAGWDLSPWKGTSSTAHTMLPLLYSGLMAVPNFGSPLDEMQYDMAESITFSPDNMTATIKLYTYIHDSKGNPIKAEDVVFSYQTAPVVGPTLYSRINTIAKSIVALDEHTIEIKANSFFIGMWETILGFCPVVNKNWYENSSSEEKANDPATTGAYRAIENVVGTYATFEAVEDFWQKEELRTVYHMQNAKTVTFVAIVEDAMRCIALENGEVDTALIENVSIGRFSNNPDFNLYEWWRTNPVTFIFNCSENSVFRDNVALRKAVWHAIDFNSVRMATAGEFGIQSHDIAGIICSDYDPAWDSQPYFDYDLDVAKQFMVESGYGLNSGLTIRFLCRNMASQVPAVTVVQSNLADIGINVVIDAFDQALYDTYLLDPTQWEMVWGSGMMTSGFVSEAWDYYLGSRGAQGTVGFVQDAKLQQLLDAVLAKNDEASKKAFREYALDQAYGVNAFNEIGYIVTRSEIIGMHFSFWTKAMLNTIIVSEPF